VRWSKTVSLRQPLSGIRVGGRAGTNGHTAEESADSRREKAAYDRGVADGERRLSEQLLRQRAEVLALQNGVFASLRQAVSEAVRQSESAVIELAVETARKLVSDLPISTEMIEAPIKSALAQVESGTEYHIHLHPEDLALLQKCNSPALLPGPGNKDMQILASAEVTRGGCVVKTRFGEIDARRETKLELIRQSLDS
jgi:flagellar assembly protein FliH